ncbi:hypothetical protein KAI68_07205 [bacterium]|nr:hypothetical protein [bacterium]
MFKLIFKELKHHAPFTSLGAFSGIIIMLLFQNISDDTSFNLFYLLHPLHVLLSAFATVSMYKLHTPGKHKFWTLVFIGYLGSIGIATLSDCLIPYLGETLLDMPHRHLHLGFIEKWYMVNPLAFLGILLAHFKPSTTFPHFGHVLLSTWASLFHIIMAIGEPLSWVSYTIVFFFLFLAVWIPCCTSDIIFPLLFVPHSSNSTT